MLVAIFVGLTTHIGLLGCRPATLSELTPTDDHPVSQPPGSNLSNSWNSADAQAKDLGVVDVGVVDLARPSFFCQPLDELGLKAAEIQSLSTSCECVHVSLARFLTQDQSWDDALFIEIDAEAIDESLLERAAQAPPQSTSELSKDLPRPANLAVTVSVQLNSGQTRELTVNFLHTVVWSAMPFHSVSTGETVHRGRLGPMLSTSGRALPAGLVRENQRSDLLVKPFPHHSLGRILR